MLPDNPHIGCRCWRQDRRRVGFDVGNPLLALWRCGPAGFAAGVVGSDAEIVFICWPLLRYLKQQLCAVIINRVELVGLKPIIDPVSIRRPVRFVYD